MPTPRDPLSDGRRLEKRLRRLLGAKNCGFTPLYRACVIYPKVGGSFQIYGDSADRTRCRVTQVWSRNTGAISKRCARQYKDFYGPSQTVLFSRLAAYLKKHIKESQIEI